MKIVNIFAEKLYSLAYKEAHNEEYGRCEYDKLIELWTDVSYLYKFAKENDVRNIRKFVNDRLRDAEQIEDLLEELVEENLPLDAYFQQLHNNETGFKLLSLRKGKASKQDGLRMYAIKIDDDCFLVTGGAIKMSLYMKDHRDTKEELRKLEKAKAFLKDNAVMDADSFCEFKKEIDENEYR
ncbi:hypothetical protein [Mesonia sp. K4-1]|uniref:hypothetical protein n=1 Tax=Mesonia sp. K4-1 TaxID=2602760 RepID=UPI0011CA63A2|nr:hypothetical protein [Mesonia sp. K4-1]TXK79449.1 hypothetical protein FT986_01030 [Mesonia sp. K4-1]